MLEPLNDESRAVVAVEPVTGDVRAAVRRALEGAEWRRVVPRGADVSLKVNLGWDLSSLVPLRLRLSPRHSSWSYESTLIRSTWSRPTKYWKTSNRRSTAVGWLRCAGVRA